MGERDPQELWDAYDESVQAWLAAHDDATAVEAGAWISSLPGAARSSLSVQASSAETLVFIWTEDVYVSGGRASVFARRSGAWKRTDYRDFSEGSKVRVSWESAGAMIIAEHVRGADAEWVTLHGFHVADGVIVRDFDTEPLMDPLLSSEADALVVTYSALPSSLSVALSPRLHRRTRYAHDTRGFSVRTTSESPALDALEGFCGTRWVAVDAARPFAENNPDLFGRLPDCDPPPSLQSIDVTSEGIHEAHLRVSYVCAGRGDDDAMRARTEEVVIAIRRSADGVYRIHDIRAADPGCVLLHQAPN